MPSLYNSTPGADLDQQDQTAATAPYTGAARAGALFGESFDYATRSILHGAAEFGQVLARPTNAQGYAYDPRAKLDTDTLNDRYGVPGVLRFNEPTNEDDAAFRQSMAFQQRQLDTVLSRSNPQPLTDFAASTAGTMLNPLNLALAAVTDGLGDAVLTGAGLARSVGEVGMLGRIANAARVPLEGAIGNAPFVALDAAAHGIAGDDYDMGDALRDIAAGAVLHTAAHVAFRALPGLFRRGGAAADPEALADPNAPDLAAQRPALEPDPAPPAGVPAEVDALPAEARQGAFVKAVEDMAADRPVDVAGHVQTELETRAAAAEAAGETADPAASPSAPPLFDLEAPGFRSATIGDTTIGYTVRGGMVEVNSVKTPEAARGKGSARAAMRAIIEEADRAGARLGLTPEPMDRATTKKGLDRFYSSLGFKRNVGRGRDLSVNVAMLREAAGREPPDEAASILAATARRFATGDAGELDTLRPPGRSDGGAAGGGDERADQGRPGPGAGDGGQAAARPSAEQLIAADPELKAIAEATDRYAADNGVTPAEPPEARQPATLADALHAAAVCLIGELG